MSEKYTTVTYKIKNSRPIEMEQYGRALVAFGEEFKEMVMFDRAEGESDGVGLHLTSLREGSVIAEAAALATYALPIADYAAAIPAYVELLAQRFAWLKGSGDVPKRKVGRESLQNLANIVAPAVNDAGSHIYVFEKTKRVDAKEINLSHADATAVWHGAKRELAQLSQRRGGVHEKVAMHWYQARYDPKSRHGDRSIIESIFPGAVRTIFANDGVKGKMLAGNKNPFKMAFIVDVVVETIEDRPVLYRIIDVGGPVR